MKVAVYTLGVLSALILGSRWFLSHPEQKDISPWPEFEPISQIMISSHLFEFGSLATELMAAAKKENIKVSVLEDLNPMVENWGEIKAKNTDVAFLPMAHSGVWIRDFAPLNIDITQKSSGLATLGFADFNYKLEPTLDDILPWQLALYFKDSLIKTPFTVDGGNFVATRDDCFLADDFIDRTSPNAIANQESEKERISDMIGKEFGCRAHIFSNSPHPHMDMILKPLSSNQIVVSQIPDYVVSHLKEHKALNLDETMAVQGKLNEIAKTLEDKLHFKVIRIPMPSPSSRLFRNYVNSVILEKTILMPSYKESAHLTESYPDLDLLGRLENEARQTYETLGYKVIPLNSDRIIAAGGSLHCVTLTIPK
ncbi:MAG: agmatine deiminase family protein [Pseudomonadota bacterium]